MNKFIINDKIENTVNLDINQINNAFNNIFYKNDFGLYNIYNISDLNNNNNFIDINNLVYNQTFSLYNNNKNTLYEFYINNQIINNISQKKYNIINDMNSIENEKRINDVNNIYALELKDNNIKNKKSRKKNKNKKSSSKVKKNIFKVITKVSRYRGVTKNKKKWQSYIRINRKNTYLGSYKSEIIAAKIYDLMFIKKMVMLQKLILSIIADKLKKFQN